jgi:hypothetical protein
MVMSIRAVVACAIPSAVAVAVIGFIFFWTRKKPEPDKRSTSKAIKSDVQNAEPVVSEQDIKDSSQDVRVTASGLEQGFEEEPFSQASESVEIEAVPLIEEELVCSVAQSSESAIAPSFVDDLGSAPVHETASNLSGLQCDQDISEVKHVVPVVVESELGNCATEAESSDGHCTCPTTSNGAQAGSALESDEGKLSKALVSDRKRVDSGLEESHVEDAHIDNDKVDASLVKSTVERPDSIPPSPRHPLPADSPNDHLNNSDSVSEASEVCMMRFPSPVEFNVDITLSLLSYGRMHKIRHLL